MVKIDLNMLNIVIEKTIQGYLKQLSIDSVVIDNDYYWEIPGEERYSVPAEPSELVIGQITEDIDFLNQIVTNKREPTAHTLVQLASLLRAIGDTGESQLYLQSRDQIFEK